MSILWRLRSAATDVLSALRKRTSSEECEYQDVDAGSVGSPTGKEPASIERGRVLQDRDDDQSKQLLVTAVREQRADQFEVPDAGQTVADYNLEYPAADPVIEVRFFETLDAHLGKWTIEDVLRHEVDETLDAGDPYYYPESRVEVAPQQPEAAPGD